LTNCGERCIIGNGRKERRARKSAKNNMDKTILTIGNATMDVLLNVPFAPGGGRTAFSKDKYEFTSGGSGAYTAVAAKRAGTDAVLCARIGEDEMGKRLLDEYRENGVNINYMARDAIDQTGLNLYIVEEFGPASKICYPGANKNLNSGNIEFAFNSYPNLVTASLEIEEELVRYVSNMARAKEIPFVLDASGAYESLRLDRIGTVDVFIADEKDVEIITGIRPGSPEDCLRASISLFNRMDVKYAVLKLSGRRAAHMYDGKYCHLLESARLQSIDRRAQQQSFVGAFCSQLLSTGDPYRSTEYALAASTIAASKAGGISSIPNDGEIRSLLN